MRTEIERRFKILFLLTNKLGIWDKQMTELANAIDSKHPEAKRALTFYENAIIDGLEPNIMDFPFANIIEN